MEKLDESTETIYDTMNPELKEILEEILNAKVKSNDGVITKIKKYINCESDQKNALMRLFVELEKIGINVSKYYPKEYEEYKKIKKDVIKTKKNDLKSKKCQEQECK